MERSELRISAAVNSMSWYNPSQDEVADEYYSSKSRYTNAANQRYAAERAAENCCAEKAQAQRAIASCMSDKINFEKRIEDIRTIIGALDGSASGVLVSLLGADIPSLITKFNSAAQQTGESYKGSMKCLDIAAASIADIFRGKTVEEDAWLSDALQKFRDEMARLQQALQDLQNQINALEATVTDLTSKINMYNAEQADWRKVMMSSAFEMNHYRSYM